VEEGLQVEPLTLAPTPTLIDLRISVLKKWYGSYYEPMEKFYAPLMQILMRKATHKLHQSTMRVL